MSDTRLLDALIHNSWDLRCINVPTGGDDYDIQWIVIEHHQAEPCEREVGRSFNDDPREAISDALKNQKLHDDCRTDRCQYAASIGVSDAECADECQYKVFNR